ncbi:decarboxylase [Nanoarchaeota archaeon]
MAKFILSKNKVLEQYNILKNIVDSISYSIKTNINVGKILENETDCMFSIHSLNELKYVNNKSRLMLLCQAITKKQLYDLYELNIKTFVVDNETDLNTILNWLNDSDKKINLLLRWKIKENTIHTGKHFMFGMESNVISKFILKSNDYPQIENIGIHFHRRTQKTSEWDLKDEIEESFSSEVLEQINMVCIGGGIPEQYKNFSENISNYVLNKIKELIEFLHKFNIKVIAEPGRFLCARPIKLECNIIGIHENIIVVDASVYNSDTDAVFSSHLRLLIEGEVDNDWKDENGEKPNKYTIKGMTPCSLDIFRYDVKLPFNLKLGDKIIFLNAGAYNFHTDFCSLDRIETVVVD